jgi:hypothetical protein
MKYQKQISSIKSKLSINELSSSLDSNSMLFAAIRENNVNAKSRTTSISSSVADDVTILSTNSQLKDHIKHHNMNNNNVKKINKNNINNTVTHCFTEKHALTNRRGHNKSLLNQRFKNLPVLHDLNNLKKLTASTFPYNSNISNNSNNLNNIKKAPFFYGNNSNNLISMTTMTIRYFNLKI